MMRDSEMWIIAVDAGQVLVENVGDVIADLLDSLDSEASNDDTIYAIKNLMKAVNVYQNALLSAAKPPSTQILTSKDLDESERSLAL